MDDKTLINELTELKVEKEKLLATVEDIKSKRDGLKETNATLVEQVETLTRQNQDLTGKVSAIETEKLEVAMSNLAKDDFKVKDKFAKLMFEQAELGEDVDYTNLTQEQRDKVLNVIENNPEYKLEVSELSATPQTLSTEEIMEVGDGTDNSNFTNT